MSYGNYYLTNLMPTLHPAQTHVIEIGYEKIAATSWELWVSEKFDASLQNDCFHSLRSWIGLILMIMQPLKSKKCLMSSHPSNLSNLCSLPWAFRFKATILYCKWLLVKIRQLRSLQIRFQSEGIQFMEHRLGLGNHWNPGQFSYFNPGHFYHFPVKYIVLTKKPILTQPSSSTSPS